MPSTIRLGRALLASLCLIAAGFPLAAAAAPGASGASYRCEGTRARCAPLLDGAAWIEEYGTFVVFGRSSTGENGSKPENSKGRLRATRLSESIQLGTYAFDPASEDPAAAVDRARGAERAAPNDGDDFVVQFDAPIRQ